MEPTSSYVNYGTLGPKKNIIDIEHDGLTGQVDISCPMKIITVVDDSSIKNAMATLPKPTKNIPNGKIVDLEDPLPHRKVQKRPQNYYRFAAKSGEQLDKEVEYDMDEEDCVWLDLINKEKEGKGAVSQVAFEYIMDRLEKESFFLSHAQGVQGSMPVDEDAVCCVCKDGECENTNAILFCDACNIPVHQECYGVPFIPEGQWLCRRCQLSPSHVVKCILCPNKGGAFKQTTKGDWAHVSCALWIPEAHFANDVFLEPIDIEQIPKARFKLSCILCGKKGTCIQCTKSTCYSAYHVSCAQKSGLYMNIEMVEGEEHSKKTSFCPSHAPKGHKSAINNSHATNSSSSLEPEVPVLSIPSVSENEVVKMLQRYQTIPKKKPIANRILSYWTLKRQSRSGIPLLRRLQSHQGGKTSSKDAIGDAAENSSQLSTTVQQLRLGLERLRLLAELVLKRERMKREIVKNRRDFFRMSICPLHNSMKHILDELSKSDHFGIFAQPVSSTVVDYYDIIKQPMDLMTMRSKLDSYRYSKLEELKSDFELMISNAKTYNTSDSHVYFEARRINRKGIELLKQATKSCADLQIDENGFLKSLLPKPKPVRIRKPPAAKAAEPEVPERKSMRGLIELPSLHLQSYKSNIAVFPSPSKLNSKNIGRDERRRNTLGSTRSADIHSANVIASSRTRNGGRTSLLSTGNHRGLKRNVHNNSANGNKGLKPTNVAAGNNKNRRGQYDPKTVVVNTRAQRRGSAGEILSLPRRSRSGLLREHTDNVDDDVDDNDDASIKDYSRNSRTRNRRSDIKPEHEDENARKESKDRRNSRYSNRRHDSSKEDRKQDAESEEDGEEMKGKKQHERRLFKTRRGSKHNLEIDMVGSDDSDSEEEAMTPQKSRKRHSVAASRTPNVKSKKQKSDPSPRSSRYLRRTSIGSDRHSDLKNRDKSNSKDKDKLKGSNKTKTEAEGQSEGASESENVGHAPLISSRSTRGSSARQSLMSQSQPSEPNFKKKPKNNSHDYKNKRIKCDVTSDKDDDDDDDDEKVDSRRTRGRRNSLRKEKEIDEVGIAEDKARTDRGPRRRSTRHNLEEEEEEKEEESKDLVVEVTEVDKAMDGDKEKEALKQQHHVSHQLTKSGKIDRRRRGFRRGDTEQGADGVEKEEVEEESNINIEVNSDDDINGGNLESKEIISHRSTRASQRNNKTATANSTEDKDGKHQENIQTNTNNNDYNDDDTQKRKKEEIENDYAIAMAIAAEEETGERSRSRRRHSTLRQQASEESNSDQVDPEDVEGKRDEETIRKPPRIERRGRKPKNKVLKDIENPTTTTTTNNNNNNDINNNNSNGITDKDDKNDENESTDGTQSHMETTGRVTRRRSITNNENDRMKDNDDSGESGSQMEKKVVSEGKPLSSLSLMSSKTNNLENIDDYRDDEGGTEKQKEKMQMPVGRATRGRQSSDSRHSNDDDDDDDNSKVNNKRSIGKMQSPLSTNDNNDDDDDDTYEVETRRTGRRKRFKVNEDNHEKLTGSTFKGNKKSQKRKALEVEDDNLEGGDDDDDDAAAIIDSSPTTSYQSKRTMNQKADTEDRFQMRSVRQRKLTNFYGVNSKESKINNNYINNDGNDDNDVVANQQKNIGNHHYETSQGKNENNNSNSTKKNKKKSLSHPRFQKASSSGHLENYFSKVNPNNNNDNDNNNNNNNEDNNINSNQSSHKRFLKSALSATDTPSPTKGSHHRTNKRGGAAVSMPNSPLCSTIQEPPTPKDDDADPIEVSPLIHENGDVDVVIDDEGEKEKETTEVDNDEDDAWLYQRKTRNSISSSLDLLEEEEDVKEKKEKLVKKMIGKVAASDDKEDRSLDGQSNASQGSNDVGGESVKKLSHKARRNFVFEMRNVKRTYKINDLVWAKQEQFPYFPGKVTNPSKKSKIIPTTVLERQSQSVKTEPIENAQDYLLISFFGKRETWCWVHPSKILPLGSNKDLDDAMLKEVKSTKRKVIKECYHEALDSVHKKKSSKIKRAHGF